MLTVVFFLTSWICFVTSTTYTCDRTLSCGCSTMNSVTTSARILGGEDAPDNAWGWMVSLQYNGKHSCGATLISAEYAITAAHCLKSDVTGVQRLSIMAGTNNLDTTNREPIQRRNVLAVYIHPDFNIRTLQNNIAVIRFDPLSIDDGSTLSFICLPEQDRDPFVQGTDLIALGWGYKALTDYMFSRRLQQVTLQALVSNDPNCAQREVGDPKLRFCAGVTDGKKDTCLGDSGGPLMAFVNNQWILAGLPSWARGCTSERLPSLYTRVSNYISFIHFSLDNPNSANVIVPTTVKTNTSATNAPNSSLFDFEYGSSAGNHGNLCVQHCFSFVFLLTIFLFHIM